MEQFPPFRSFVMCVPRSKGFLETPFDMDAEGLPTAAKKGWNRKMFEQWFEEAKTLGLIFFNYKGPIVTIKGHEVEYDAKNPSQSKPKEVNGTAHPNNENGCNHRELASKHFHQCGRRLYSSQPVESVSWDGFLARRVEPACQAPLETSMGTRLLA